MRMDGINAPSRAPMKLLSFNSRSDLDNYSLGVDSVSAASNPYPLYVNYTVSTRQDIGGTSTARLDFVPDADSSDPNGKGKARFWGDMRLGVRSDLRGKIRGGYAGFRSKVK